MVTEIIELKDSDELIGIDENFKLTAGPGSGKTRFLINHVKNVIKNSNKLKKGQKIACITHTNTAVDEIKKRLKNSINEVEVTTIHSFLYKHVVKPYLWTIIDEFELNIDSKHQIKETFPSYSLTHNNFYWQIQNYNINDETLNTKLKKLKWSFEEGELKLKIPNFYLPPSYLREYKNKCWKKGLLSPDDILFFSYHILNNHARIRDILKIKFPYLFLDEFQDTSSLQSEIIKLIAHSKITIGVIGDYAQSIYKFQGADVDSFLNFEIDEKFNQYELKNNHRSNNIIVNILNHIRNDNFKQKACKTTNKSIIPPTIIVGSEINAYNYIKTTLTPTPFYSLSYKSNYVESLKFKLKYGENINHIDDKFMDKIFITDNNYHRRQIIRYTILAIESFRNKNIKDALKFIKHAYKNYFDDNNIALENLFRLNSQYTKFIKLPITEFYNQYIYGYYGVKYQIRPSEVKNKYYDKFKYIDFASNLNDIDSNSKFRTIHSCKGKEFNSIALFLESETNLEFLLEPNIHKESNRVYYVALSRAKENMIINVQTLNNNSENILKQIGFEVIHI